MLIQNLTLEKTGYIAVAAGLLCSAIPTVGTTIGTSLCIAGAIILVVKVAQTIFKIIKEQTEISKQCKEREIELDNLKGKLQPLKDLILEISDIEPDIWIKGLWLKDPVSQFASNIGFIQSNK